MSFQDFLGGPSPRLNKTLTRTTPVTQSPRRKTAKTQEIPKKEHDVAVVAPAVAPSVVTPERSAEVRRRSPPQSRYGKLNEEITHLQTMVRQLEVLVHQCGESPENQWRLRILLQSAQESDRDLGVRIREFRLTLGSIKDRAVRSSRAKLIRDYERVHKLFAQVSEEYQTKQLQAISHFSGGGGSNTTMTSHEYQRRLAAREQEDFFERAMREREVEVSNINHSMHRVNEIYNELGNIIESQQEAIDRISLRIDDGKWNTRAGLHHLEKANISLFHQSCGSIADVVLDDEKRSPPRTCTQTANATRKRSRRKKSGMPDTKQEFRWTMPFETMGDDMMEVVNKDILGLGRDVISTSQRKLKSAGGMLSCSAVPTDGNEEAGVAPLRY